MPQIGKGCTIQDLQAVTQDNFCPGSTAAAQDAASNSDQQGGAVNADAYNYADDDEHDEDDYDYEDGSQGADESSGGVSSDEQDDNSDDDDEEDSDDAQGGNGGSSETGEVMSADEGSNAAGCSRLQDFTSLVDRADFEYEKELIEGHIRSNSLVFNTFIFLQVSFQPKAEYLINPTLQDMRKSIAY